MYLGIKIPIGMIAYILIDLLSGEVEGKILDQY
jgi:hypothetical protein